MTLGDIAKAIPILTKCSGIYPNIFKSSQNKLKQIFKIFRPLHHPPLKTSLVPETKTKHTARITKERWAMPTSQNLVPRQGSPRSIQLRNQFQRKSQNEMAMGSLFEKTSHLNQASRGSHKRPHNTLVTPSRNDHNIPTKS